MAVMADADDYESLPQTSSMSTHMLAGAAAGIMEHCVMYPVDCVKVRIYQLKLWFDVLISGVFTWMYIWILP